MPHFNLAIIQFPRQGEPLPESTKKMAGYLSEVPAAADLILLPEGWLGPAPLEWETYQEIMLSLLSYLTNPTALIVSGAQYVKTDSHLVARGMFLRQDWSSPVIFEKLFPSQAIGERNFIYPGNKLPVVEHRGILIGAAVCVDFFYPEVVRNLALRGASLVVNPANIPVNRIALWQHLGVARACENTIFTAMANNTHTRYPDGREIMGGSFVAYPNGFTLLSFGQSPGVYYTELDLDLIPQVRQRWPYLEDIRQRGKGLLVDEIE